MRDGSGSELEYPGQAEERPFFVWDTPIRPVSAEEAWAFLDGEVLQ